MLLALRSLYETETPVVPPTRGGRKYRRKIHGHPPFIPPFREEATAELVGIEIGIALGRITANASGSILLFPSPETRFELGQPIIQAGGTARIQGTGIKVESGHDIEPASVTLGARGNEIDDEESAIMLLLGN